MKRCAAMQDAAEQELLEREPLEGGDGDSWLVVTRPTQLAAVDGHLRLRQGLDKSALPGFAQLNPGGRNAFYVLYKFHGKFYEIEGVLRPPSGFACVPHAGGVMCGRFRQGCGVTTVRTLCS